MVYLVDNGLIKILMGHPVIIISGKASGGRTSTPEGGGGQEKAEGGGREEAGGPGRPPQEGGAP